jgi:hypothetical protein
MGNVILIAAMGAVWIVIFFLVPHHKRGTVNAVGRIVLIGTAISLSFRQIGVF